MDQDNAPVVSSNAKSLCGKSWTAYFSIGLIALFVLPIAVSVAWQASWVAGIAVLVLVLAVIAYRVLVIRSFHLYYDDVGVWVYSGVLPWSKGVAGVKWRDLDEAVYFQTFWSWLFKSYSMRIGHRFTKSSELFLSHMARGHESVMEINGQHQELVRANALG
ncbi:hypothetical protein LNV23_10560 [Paucibacter sp. DJ1R-11]|uniref:hypothetical protein n=1 Tax=Paucibacter sp. DJ1R-11 TaxID=2893556 RepID=UPI0021E3D745|nr:hypothetical protein [Paucibacter sp. DJ1R-11]MCV2363888.1 hypothetical protein [Paucibacter sp. DJ1R-11]